LDTREKVLALEAVPALVGAGEWTAVAGLFDPLTLSQAERLAALARKRAGQKILAVVLPDPEALLPAAARAALVASLRSVDAVVIAQSEELRRCGIALEEDARAERKRSAEFVRFVLRRQKAEVPLAGSRR
jgi:hypothetical protein